MDSHFLPADPKPSVVSSLKLVDDIFPLKNEEGLKIYAILSARKDIAAHVDEETTKLVILGAYTLDQALQSNQAYLTTISGAQDIKPGIMVASLPYPNLVPPLKMAEMIEKIQKKEGWSGPAIDPTAKNVDDLSAYARYVFDKAAASPYEKGILTNILGRFRRSLLPVEKPVENV